MPVLQMNKLGLALKFDIQLSLRQWSLENEAMGEGRPGDGFGMIVRDCPQQGCPTELSMMAAGSASAQSGPIAASHVQ